MALQVTPQPCLFAPPPDLLDTHPHLRFAAADLARLYAARTAITDQQLQRMGSALWQALDGAGQATEQLQAARSQAGNQIVPIVIESEEPAIQQLPWESLHHPELGFLGIHPHFTLSRRLRGDRPNPAPPPRGPLRVLLFTAMPEETDPEKSRLDVEEEQAQVQEALAPWIAEGRVVLEMPNDGRFETFQAALAEYQPHLLFLSGHGLFHKPAESDHPGEGRFLFEGPHGEPTPVGQEAIAQALVGIPLECLLLSACESGKAASDALASGLARRLALQGLAHVVGMRESILDRAGTQFTRTFCDHLVKGERVDLALQRGRAAITQPLGDDPLFRDAHDRSLAELSLGQWCLPMALSPDPGRPLIDWAFTPQPPEGQRLNQSLATVTLPPRFLGRRRELRALEQALRSGARRQLLITGPGGQGKTALAGRLAQAVQADGAEVLAWSARLENPWAAFRTELEFMFSNEETEQYERLAACCDSEACRATTLLRLLLRTHPRLLLLLDNLESLQDPQTRALTDPTVAAWISAAQPLRDQGLTLLLTSRWRLPEWPEADHWALGHSNLGDFLQQARLLGLPPAFYRGRDRLRRVHRTLHGNARGLQFLAAALEGMDLQQEAAFLAALEQAEAEVQADMALAAVVAQRSADERDLLARLTAYRTPVPEEGVIKLACLPGQALPRPKALLEQLVALSLVEPIAEPATLAVTYQCPATVAAWLARQADLQPSAALLTAAAAYQGYRFHHEQKSLPQAMAVHEALLLAGERTRADRWVLEWIVEPLNRAGLYQSLLDEWLAPLAESADAALRGEALNQIGKQHLHLSDYATAQDYLQQALEILRAVGDRAGEGTTLNNISQIYKVRGDYATAQDYLQQALEISRAIGDRAGEGTTLNNMATAAHARGDYESALDYLQQVLEISRAISDRAGEGTTLNNISQIYDARGDYESALDHLQQALKIQRAIGDRAGEGATLNNISQIYHARGDYESALDHLQQALEIRRAIGDRAGEGTTLNNISQIYDARGDYESALDYLQQALEIRRAIGDVAGEGTTLNNMATVAHARGDYETALDHLQQSLEIRRAIGDVAGLCATLFNMGHIQLQNEQPQQARQLWGQVYALAKPRGQADALQALAGLAERFHLPGGLDGWAAFTPPDDPP